LCFLGKKQAYVRAISLCACLNLLCVLKANHHCHWEGNLRSTEPVFSAEGDSTDHSFHLETVCVLSEAQEWPAQELRGIGILINGNSDVIGGENAGALPCWSISYTKRAFDIALALPLLAIAALPMAAIGLCVRLSSAGPAFYVQERVGRRGILFRIYKFRSMVFAREAVGPGLTKGGDPRITPLGRWLRKFKLDELPQLYNVLRGDLSFVGPRPKLPQYEVDFNMPYRPGITGASTLVFRNEEDILRDIPLDEVDAYYEKHIKPLKARLDSRYMTNATFSADVKIIAATVFGFLLPSKQRSMGSKKPSRANANKISVVLSTEHEAIDTASGF
jgi:lipopolysaccharide/colanic/teichoic acid biosynthesis glycosyltransferase